MGYRATRRLTSYIVTALQSGKCLLLSTNFIIGMFIDRVVILLLPIFSAEHRYSLGSTAETYNDGASASRSSQQPMVPPVPQHESLEAPRALGAYRSGNSLQESSPSNSSDGFGASSPNTGGSPYDDTEPMVSSYARQQDTTPPNLRPSGGAQQQSSRSGYFGQPAQTVSYDQQPRGYAYSPATPSSAYTSQAPTPSRRQDPVTPPPVQGLPRPKPGARRASTQATQTLAQAQSQTQQTPTQTAPPARGFTLTDPGVVTPAGSNPNVRRVLRNSKRSSTTPTGGYGGPAGGTTSPPPPSTSSHGGGGGRGRGSPSQLPPGAAPPQYPRYGS